MKVLLFGGTGTLGASLIEAMPKDDITVFSRSEQKQAELHRKYGVKCVLGDIRDQASVNSVLMGKYYNLVINTAALKFLPLMEDNPLESVKTNILGVQNILNAIRVASVDHFVFSSTDKATDPSSVYGACKFISERLILNENLLKNGCNYSVVRYGNVIGSNGSFLKIFVQNILQDKPVILSHSHMTRFFLKIEDAVGFILSTYRTKSDVPKIPKMRATKIMNVVTALEEILGKKAILQIGIPKPGEKLAESMVSRHSSLPQIDSDNEALHFSHEELVEFLRPEVLKLC